MSDDLDAKVCRCGHTAHWHGASNPESPRDTMGQGGCDSCDCQCFVEARTDSIASLRHSLKSERELTKMLAGALREAAEQLYHAGRALCNSGSMEQGNWAETAATKAKAAAAAEHDAGDLAKAEGENG